MVGAEDTKLPLWTFVKMLDHHIKLAWCNIWFAVETNRGDTVLAIEKLCGLEMIKEFTLSPSIDTFEAIDFVKQSYRIWMSQQEIFQIAPFGRRWYDCPCLVTIAGDNQHPTEIQGINKTFNTLKLFIKAIVGEITGNQDKIRPQRLKLPSCFFQQRPGFR
jgi:hypothetical protein